MSETEERLRHYFC